MHVCTCLTISLCSALTQCMWCAFAHLLRRAFAHVLACTLLAHILLSDSLSCAFAHISSLLCHLSQSLYISSYYPTISHAHLHTSFLLSSFHPTISPMHLHTPFILSFSYILFNYPTISHVHLHIPYYLSSASLHLTISNISKILSLKYIRTHPPVSHLSMGWLCLVGTLKLHVSSAKEPCNRNDILQKRLIILKGPTDRSHSISLIFLSPILL